MQRPGQSVTQMVRARLTHYVHAIGQVLGFGVVEGVLTRHKPASPKLLKAHLTDNKPNPLHTPQKDIFGGCPPARGRID